jgi:hypothetical protein
MGTPRTSDVLHYILSGHILCFLRVGDQATIGAAVQIDRACDVAAVVEDGPFSDRGLNWTDSYSDAHCRSP